jgi:hypothetical protein
MIDKKLDELGIYSEKIEKTHPIKLIDDFINKIEKEISSLTEEDLLIGNCFGNTIIKTIEEYKKKGIIDSLISYHLLSVLVSYIKKTLIISKANMLGIEKNLFKQEMRLLFKGTYK